MLEYASHGNLFHLIRKRFARGEGLSEDDAFYFFVQAAAGIYFLQKKGFIHRDLKPENLLLCERNEIKICDFGWCVQQESNQQRTTFCGTLEYMAPEMITCQPHNHTIDVWSLGVLLYELCHAKAPFRGSQNEIVSQILAGTIAFKAGLSKEYKTLVRVLLQQQPEARLPLVKVFSHPWVLHFQQKYNIVKEPRQPLRNSTGSESLSQEF